jgi:hypothetical protein
MEKEGEAIPQEELQAGSAATGQEERVQEPQADASSPQQESYRSRWQGALRPNTRRSYADLVNGTSESDEAEEESSVSQAGSIATEQESSTGTSSSTPEISRNKWGGVLRSNTKKSYVDLTAETEKEEKEKRGLRRLFDGTPLGQRCIALVQECQKSGKLIKWRRITNEISKNSQEAKAMKLTPKALRDFYIRQLNPDLHPLTEDIKGSIKTDLEKGKFRSEEGGVHYTQLARHYHVADHIIRNWIMLDSKLKTEPFILQLREQENQRIRSRMGHMTKV